jgi:IclR family pca regulon transcriptional regulator
VLLSATTDEEITGLLQKTKIEARTPKTVTDRKQILEIIRKTRERGYATNDQELELDLFGMSVPIKNRAGRVVASLNVNSQARRITAKRIIDILLPAMRESAQAISGVLL